MKCALVTTRDDLKVAGVDLGHGRQLLPIPATFWNVPTKMVDRAICETDSSTQQLLPYITLRNGDRVFVYGRGPKGGEQRLMGKLSCGLGGHIDTVPPGSLDAHVRNEAARELAEEASLICNRPFTFQGLISDQLPDGNDVPVGSVHLGIWGIAHVLASDLGDLEDGIILAGEWMTPQELIQNFDRFESWSQLAILHMLAS